MYWAFSEVIQRQLGGRYDLSLLQQLQVAYRRQGFQEMPSESHRALATLYETSTRRLFQHRMDLERAQVERDRLARFSPTWDQTNRASHTRRRPHERAPGTLGSPWTRGS